MWLLFMITAKSSFQYRCMHLLFLAQIFFSKIMQQQWKNDQEVNPVSYSIASLSDPANLFRSAQYKPRDTPPTFSRSLSSFCFFLLLLFLFYQTLKHLQWDQWRTSPADTQSITSDSSQRTTVEEFVEPTEVWIQSGDLRMSLSKQCLVVFFFTFSLKTCAKDNMMVLLSDFARRSYLLWQKWK